MFLPKDLIAVRVNYYVDYTDETIALVTSELKAREAVRELREEGLGKRLFNGVVVEGLAMQMGGRQAIQNRGHASAPAVVPYSFARLSSPISSA